MALIDDKRAELADVKKKGVAVFIAAMKKTIDELMAKGIIRP